MRDTSTEAVLKWLSGDASAEAIAAEHGLTVAELERARAIFIAGARGAQGRQSLRGTIVAAAVIVAGALGLVSREAWAANCAQTLPSPLTTFCAGEPAKASEMNGNFEGVLTEVRNKVGPYGGSNVLIGGSLAVAGNANLNGNAAITGSLGLNATRKSCASAPCYCNTTQQFPIAWSATCNGSGIGLYSANVVQDSSQHWGYDLKCITSTFTTQPPALNVVLYCAQLSLTVQ